MKLVPKKQTAWGTLEYKGPQYYEVIEQMKREDPQAYNRLQIEKAKDQQSNSEIVNYIDAEGKPRTAPVVKGMSNADPIGQLYVEGVALNPVFKGLGRVAEYGLAKAGNNWARARILSREMQNISIPNNVLASIYDNPDQYKGRISDRVINYIKQRKEVGKSLEDSRDFIQSTAVKNSKETNQKIADRLSLPRQAEYDLQRKPVIYHHTFGQKNYNYKGVSSDNVGGYYDRTKKTINLRQNYPNLQAAKTIPFHENLHAQGYGPSAVNEWKIQYLIDKDKIVNMSKRDKDYFLSSEELPVHTATLGKSWGIKSGQPYPGDKAFDEMLYNKGIGGASYYLKYNTPKDKRRFWRTLNGTMFGLSPLIILNKNK